VRIIQPFQELVRMAHPTKNGRLIRAPVELLLLLRAACGEP